MNDQYDTIDNKQIHWVALQQLQMTLLLGQTGYSTYSAFSGSHLLSSVPTLSSSEEEDWVLACDRRGGRH